MADPEMLWRAGMSAQRPAVVVKDDLLPAISMLSLLALLGIPLGWLWSVLAPPLRLQVLGGDQVVALPEESYHRFDAIAIFVLLGLGAGLLAAALVWLRRNRRGPVLLVAACGGMVLAGWLGMLMGGAFANSRYPAGAPPRVGDIVVQAPAIETSWVLLAAPLALAFGYGTLAAWNGMSDLGRRLR